MLRNDLDGWEGKGGGREVSVGGSSAFIPVAASC